MIEQILNDPLMMGGVVVILVGALILQKKKGSGGPEVINPETMKERLESIFRDPVLERGSAVKDWIKMRSTSNTPVTVGLAVKAKSSDVTILDKQDDTDKSGSEYKTKEVSGTTYAVIPGSSKKKVLPKYWIVKHLGLLKEKFIQIHDIPQSHIAPGDDYIWYAPGTYLIKFNGIHRVLSVEGMSRIQELTFSKVHENYLETSQQIPEQYSVLNNRLSGQIRMENIKSENIREYMNEKDKSEKKNAMND